MNAKTVAIVGIDQETLPAGAGSGLQTLLPLVPTAAMGELGKAIDNLNSELKRDNNLISAWDNARKQYIEELFNTHKNYNKIIILTGNDVKENGGITLLMEAFDPEVTAIDVYALVHEGNDFWNFLGEEKDIALEYKNKFRFLYSESCHGADETNPLNIIGKAQKYGYDSIIAFQGLSASPLITFEFISMIAQKMPIKEALHLARARLEENLNHPQMGPIFSLLTQALAGYNNKEQILSNTENTLFYNNRIAIDDQTIATINQASKEYINYNKLIIK